FNAGHEIRFVPLNDSAAFLDVLDGDVAAVIIEGIQGVGGIQVPEDSFLQLLDEKCRENGTLLILDEIQSGYGSTVKYFARQVSGFLAHWFSMAKGLASGFTTGDVLCHPYLKPWSGMLGTPFGGNYLAAAAGLAVLEVMENEHLMRTATLVGSHVLGHLPAV